MNALLRAVVAVVLAAVGLAMLLPERPAPAGAPASAVGSARLSPAQLAAHAHQAGFRGEGLTVAVAVALAESGGNPQAHNDVAPDDSYGLWQINMLGPLGPQRRRQFGLGSNWELFDPAVNARVAHAISDGGRDWGPWTTYTRGTYRRFLDQAAQAGERP